MEESTGAVGTEQWLEVSKSWKIFAYIPSGDLWELAETPSLEKSEQAQTIKIHSSKRRKERQFSPTV